MAFYNLLFLSLSLFLLHLHSSTSQSPVKAGYWFRASEFPVSDINSVLFTHLICAFADLDPQSNNLTISTANQAPFSTFTQTVQRKNPSVKTLLSIGGGSSNSTNFSSMASQPSSRKAFIDSSIRLARTHGFHGLDLDWQYPNNASDMTNMGTLLSEWRVAVRSESNSTSQTQLLLTAAVHFSSLHDSDIYPVEMIRDSLDWVNVMAYDFKGPDPDWSGSSTGAPAGLYEPGSRFSGSKGIENWIESSMPAGKLVLGLPLYGYAWKLVDPARHGIGAPANGTATGQDIGDDGSISYNQIMGFIERSGATRVYDSSRVTDYCYSGTTWIGYDDEESIAAKVSYAKGKGLLGFFVWSVSGDRNWVLTQIAGSDGATRRSINRSRVKILIGIIAGVGGFFLACFVVVFFFRKFLKRTFGKILKRTFGNSNMEEFLQSYGALAPKRYRYSELKKMTNSFKDKLGQGGYGGVFKGKLNDGRLVAVKILNKSKGNGEEFRNEVASIGRTYHVNVVTLLGFCSEGSKRALLYEFMPNGSLEKFIYSDKSGETRRVFECERLFQIAVGIARGLEYLHRGCSMRILHFDIKPHNILLDDNFCPKISDFGLAKLCPEHESIVSMQGARGTVGYIAPEVFYRNIGRVSHKSDVYSYGMMVLEMVGGRKNIDDKLENTSEIYFPNWVYSRPDLQESLGLLGIMTDADKEIATKMILVALWCIQTDPTDRPSISKVVEILEGSLEGLQMPPKPLFISPSRSCQGSSTS